MPDAEYGHATERAQTGLLIGEAARDAEGIRCRLHVAGGLRAEPFEQFLHVTPLPLAVQPLTVGIHACSLGHMKSGDNVRYRLTNWPGVPLTPPKVLAHACELYAGKWLVYGFGANDRGFDRWVTVPDELYLREFWHLDTADPAAVADFCGKYGPLGIGPESLPPGPSHRLSRTPCYARSESELDHLVAGSEMAASMMALEHVSEAAIYQSTLRDLTRTWRFIQGRLSEAELLEAWETPDWSPAPHGGFEFSPDIHLAFGLTPALRPFHVRIEVPDDDGGVMNDWQANAYEIMCLQLANHIAEGAPLKRCDECSALFARKRDRRYAARQRRLSGGRFCSDTCEDRFHQRRHRQKKRAEQEGAKP